MFHDVVEPAGGQDGVHPDHRLGHEADEVAGLGAAGVDGLGDSLRDDLELTACSSMLTSSTAPYEP